MFTNEMLGLYPQKRVKAFDGMAVTADVWDNAHEHHRQMLSIHTRFGHGAGVLFGLEVIAGEPPDRVVYVQPGIAVDHLGRMINLPEQRAYDLREIAGQVHLVLSYGESQPRVDPSRQGEDAPRYVSAEYSLEALLSLPQTPHVELARIRRQTGGVAVRNAANPDLPAVNEIDQRYRQVIGAQSPPMTRVAVVSLIEGIDPGRAQAMVNLARHVQRTGGRRIVVETQPALDRTLQGYGLVYVVGKHTVRLSTEQMTALYDYRRQGGTIFYESQREGLNAEPGADAAFLDMMSSMGVTLQPIDDNHVLLRQPNLFTSPPDGFETQGAPRFLVGDGVIFSSYDFGGLWLGKRRVRPATRTEIRNAFEWGENIVEYGARRRK